MHYCIIAAGEGSRLREEGFNNVKPLVKVAGEYLIERLIRIFKNNYVEQITIIINEESNSLQHFLESKDFGVKINLIVKSTPSSLHSFWNIIHNSNFTECCLTTVDTIFEERNFKQYISEFISHKEYDALMGITKYIDDEKPLYVKTSQDNRVEAYLDSKDNESVDSVSAGIYCVRDKALKVVDTTINKGIYRMRNYQRALLENNLNVRSFLFSKVIDIDHVEDIAKAEKLIQQWKSLRKVLALYRQKQFSPNSENKDTLILNSVVKNIKARGYRVDSIAEENIIKDMDCLSEYNMVISMARSNKAMDLLKSIESKGVLVINSTLAIKNCFRIKQHNILQQNNIPIPKTIIIKTKDNNSKILKLFQEGNFWIKRGDFQTITRQDVCRPKTYLQAMEILEDYNNRNISEALISEHVEGDVVKFYGLRNTDFFEYYYPSEDKFHNKININESKNLFDKKLFIQQVNKTINLLDLDIYGGDAIVDKNGNFFIIDINDFPSFSSCRQKAAKSIANLVIDKYDKQGTKIYKTS